MESYRAIVLVDTEGAIWLVRFVFHPRWGAGSLHVRGGGGSSFDGESD